MGLGELTEEEAYFVLRFAGRAGYSRAIGALTDVAVPSGRLRRLVRRRIWIGGWEHPELLQWDKGLPAFEPVRDGKVRSPYPIKIGPLTLYGWGANLDVPGGCLVASWGRRSGWPVEVYISPNGTPHHPNVRWIAGPYRHKNKPAGVGSAS